MSSGVLLFLNSFLTERRSIGSDYMRLLILMLSGSILCGCGAGDVVTGVVVEEVVEEVVDVVQDET